MCEQRVAITGHRDLDEPTAAMVDTAIRALLKEFPRDIIGVSCLAAGADQIFARAVLDLGGTLEVIVPAAGYADTLDPWAREAFAELTSRASQVLTLEHPSPDPGSYRDAGLKMLDHSDYLIAVWDGRAARGPGGTAEIVEYARSRRMAVYVVWPDGAARVMTSTKGERA